MGDEEKDMCSDKVAEWEVPLNSGHFKVEFEHGTTSGKRIVRVNGKDVIKKEWMFKLVGFEDFHLADTPCRVRIDPYGLFAYRYSLEVNGKPFRKFVERQSKILKTWTVKSSKGNRVRVVLEKDTLDIWVNGTKMETESEFVDGGTKTHFQVDDLTATLHALCTGIKKQPMVYSLTYNGEEIPESRD